MSTQGVIFIKYYWALAQNKQLRFPLLVGILFKPRAWLCVFLTLGMLPAVKDNERVSL